MEFASKDDDRKVFDLPGLDQGHGFEELIERAKPSGDDDKGVGVFDEQRLSNKEVADIDPFIQVGVGLLLVGQADVEADGQGAGIGCAAIGGLHDAGSAAGGDDIVMQASIANEGTAALGGDAAEDAGVFVMLGAGLGACRAEHDNGGADACLAQRLFGLCVFEHEADTAHRITQQEIGVEGRQPVAWRQFALAVVDAGVARGHARALSCGRR